MWNSIKSFFTRRLYNMGDKRGDISIGGAIEGMNKYNNKAEVKEWTDIYEGNPSWVRKGSGKEYELISSDIGASVVSELAKKVTIEMESSVVGESERAKYLDKQYQRLLERARDITEHVLAQGGGILKPFIYNDNIGVEYIRAENFIPIKFNGLDELVDVIFVDKVEIDNKFYTKLERHTLEDDGSYTITNRAYRGDGISFDGKFTSEVPLGIVSEWADLAPEFHIENIEKPFYVYLKTPYGNNKDINSPLGVSVFSKITGLLEKYDKLYSLFIHEFEGTSLLSFIDETLFDGPNSSELKSSVFKMVNMGSNTESSPLVKIINPDIREQNYINGMESLLRKIEFNAGLAYGDLSNVNSVEKTAEEIKSSKERSYSTIVDIQKKLEAAFADVVDIMDTLATLYKLTPESKEKYEVTFNFDDSVVVSKRYKLEIMANGVEKGWIKPEFYLMEVYNLTLEEARAMVPYYDTSNTDNKDRDLDDK